MTINRGTVLALVIVAVFFVAAFACDSQARRIEELENGLHLQPQMDVINLFDYDSADLGLEDRMAAHGVPGLSLTVIDDGEIDWTKTYGLRDAPTGVPVTHHTVFEAGSASKLVTATLAMMLVENGELSLDEPVNNVLERWKIPDSEFSAERAVTLRMLLSHVSGMNRPASLFTFETDSSPTLIDVLEGRSPTINDPAVIEAVPGVRYSYSNLGYNVIQLLVEEATGESFQDVMAAMIFEPVGMDSCTYEYPFSEAMRSRVARPHDRDLKSYPNDLHPSALAHGGLMCTSEDLAKLAVEQIRMFHGQSDLMSAETFKQMLTNQHDPEDAIGGFNGQGLGLFTLSDDRYLYYAHQGYNVPGTCCLVMANPETGDGLVVMANGAGGFDLIFEILAGLADLYDWPRVEVDPGKDEVTAG